MCFFWIKHPLWTGTFINLCIKNGCGPFLGSDAGGHCEVQPVKNLNPKPSDPSRVYSQTLNKFYNSSRKNGILLTIAVIVQYSFTKLYVVFFMYLLSLILPSFGLFETISKKDRASHSFCFYRRSSFLTMCFRRRYRLDAFAVVDILLWLTGQCNRELSCGSMLLLMP